MTDAPDDQIEALEAQNKALGEAYHKRGGDMAVLRSDLKKAEAQNNLMREALEAMVYETTHLSPEERDGSHWCKVSALTLATARAALAARRGSS